MIRLFISVCVFILFPVLALASALNEQEQQIKQYLQAHQQNQIQFLKKLVEVNSGTANLQGVRQVGEMLKPVFEELGFKAHWIEEPPSLHRAGTLIAENKVQQGRKLILIAHLDTVFPVESWFQHYKQQGDQASGPGVIDDKGGIAVILYALKALQAAHELNYANITVVLTGDEEDSGKPTAISRKPLQDAARQAGVALDFEWSLAADTATIARRGIVNWQLETQGQQGHSSEIFQNSVGAGANYELVRILNDFRTQMSEEQYLSINPGLILGGTELSNDQVKGQGQAFGKGNVIASKALARGDLRFLSSEQKTQAEKQMQNILDQHLPRTQATIHFEEGIPAMPLSKANLHLLEIYSQVSQDLGYGKVKALDPGKRGAGDISHIANQVPAKLAGLGPVGTGAHSEQESLDLNSLTMQTQRAALLIYRLSR